MACRSVSYGRSICRPSVRLSVRFFIRIAHWCKPYSCQNDAS